MKITPDMAKNIRLSLGLTYADLSKKAGVSPNTIKGYESGTINTKPEIIAKISNALGIKTPRMRKVYMEVTQDDLSLPVAIADSADELAEILKLAPCSIMSSISRNKNSPWPKFIVVEILE